MGGRSEPDEGTVYEGPLVEPSLKTATSLGVCLALLLLVNGRPIGAGDTRPTERVAASLVEGGRLDLDDHPEVEPPFAQQVGEHRVSIYPVLSAILAAPVFALARLLFALDETGTALAGKVAASLFSGAAAAFLFVGGARRHSESDAALSAAVFALGTSVFSTSQALWQHPAAVLFLSWAILWVLRAEFDPVWAGRAGLPLGLAVAARHADILLVAVLALCVALRWPRRSLALCLWASPAAVFLLSYQWYYFGSPLRHGFSGTLGRFSEPWGVGHMGLLVSPGKGLLVFTPVALVASSGLVRAFFRGERWLAGSLGASAVAHWLLMGRWAEWHGGECFGPRMMTDVLPFIFLFLPEGLGIFKVFGSAVAILSVLVQLLGGFAYDYRWERLYQRPPVPGRPELWDPSKCPILFYAERRVVIVALPFVHQGKAFIRESPFVLFGPEGSRITFSGGEDPVVKGADPTLQDVFFVHGARVKGKALQMQGRWDGVFFRVRPEARMRRLELRVLGEGRGTLYVGESTFWSPAPRWSPYPMNGSFRIRHPYFFPESGGADLLVTLGKSPGRAAVELVALVSPGDPDNPIQAP
jgi:hypothetical protein